MYDHTAPPTVSIPKIGSWFWGLGKGAVVHTQAQVKGFPLDLQSWEGGDCSVCSAGLAGPLVQTQAFIVLYKNKTESA